ncbi:multicopper oxidase domain-containing protein [Nesterenkonia sp. YGD6]|uniref:multicopper oxidase domain-containing protein n=1 Tax=Nesterenkonia sp. YGD6 TaxID=2901231 RepID=UPI001F4D1E89|nr:multicopper oxidase domain-containing protein [Nesterenkonia sp. YGD6]MCH8561764.1 multicopper oxidase domain-containing protein [Nesterenkonia sp. YGD6]
MDLERIDEVVEVDTTEVWEVPEVWEVSNSGNLPRNLHGHDVEFHVVDIASRAPGPELAGWKDTVDAAPNTTTRSALRFTNPTDHTNPDLAQMLHSHLLCHEDLGMIGQFVVVEPGQQSGNRSKSRPGSPSRSQHEH